MIDYLWLTSFLCMFKVNITNYPLMFKFYSNFCNLLDQHLFGFCRLFIYFHFHPPKDCTSIFGHVLLPLKNYWFSTWLVHHVLLSTICSFARESICEAIFTFIKWKQDLKCNKILLSQALKKKILQIGLVCCWKIIRRKTMVFNYGFNYISITFWSWKCHFQLLNIFFNSK